MSFNDEEEDTTDDEAVALEEILQNSNPVIVQRAIAMHNLNAVQSKMSKRSKLFRNKPDSVEGSVYSEYVVEHPMPGRVKEDSNERQREKRRSSKFFMAIRRKNKNKNKKKKQAKTRKNKNKNKTNENNVEIKKEKQNENEKETKKGKEKERGRGKGKGKPKQNTLKRIKNGFMKSIPPIAKGVFARVIHLNAGKEERSTLFRRIPKDQENNVQEAEDEEYVSTIGMMTRMFRNEEILEEEREAEQYEYRRFPMKEDKTVYRKKKPLPKDLNRVIKAKRFERRLHKRKALEVDDFNRAEASGSETDPLSNDGEFDDNEYSYAASYFSDGSNANLDEFNEPEVPLQTQAISHVSENKALKIVFTHLVEAYGGSQGTVHNHMMKIRSMTSAQIEEYLTQIKNLYAKEERTEAEAAPEVEVEVEVEPMQEKGPEVKDKEPVVTEEEAMKKKEKVPGRTITDKLTREIGKIFKTDLVLTTSAATPNMFRGSVREYLCQTRIVKQRRAEYMEAAGMRTDTADV